MGDGDIPDEFTLTYEMQPDDLVDMMKVSRTRKRRRAQYTVAVAMWVLVAIGVAVYRVLARRDHVNITPWIYLGQTFALLTVLYLASILWRLSPRRLGMKAWRRTPGLHGLAQNVIDSAGVSDTAPDGTRHYWPWTVITQVEETERAFYLMTSAREPRAALIKRGLPDPGLVPVLRDFLHRKKAGASGTIHT